LALARSAPAAPIPERIVIKQRGKQRREAMNDIWILIHLKA